MTIQHKSAHWRAVTKQTGNLTIMDDSGASISYERHEGISLRAAREIVRSAGAAAFNVTLCQRVR